MISRVHDDGTLSTQRLTHNICVHVCTQENFTIMHKIIPVLQRVSSPRGSNFSLMQAPSSKKKKKMGGRREPGTEAKEAKLPNSMQLKYM